MMFREEKWPGSSTSIGYLVLLRIGEAAPDGEQALRLLSSY